MRFYPVLQGITLLDKIPPRVVAIEVKRAERWERSWGKAMRSLEDAAGVKAGRMIGVYCEVRS
jgi:hypothetical protein